MPQFVPWDYKTGPLSEAELATILELGDQRKTAHFIAQRINRHPSTVYYQLLKNGLAKKPRPSRPEPYMRGGRQVRPFTEAEDAFILERRLQGQGWSWIARALQKQFGWPRPPNSIGARLMQLACAEDPD